MGVLFTGHRLLIAGRALIAASGLLWQSTPAPGSGYSAGIAGPTTLIALGPEAGAASGLMNTTKQTGATLGLAVLVAATSSPSTTPGLAAP